MVESKNSPDNYETLKITIEAIMKNPEILKFVPDHLNTKKMSKNRIKKLSFAIIFVPNQYKTHEMRDKVVSKEPFILNYCNKYVIKLLMLFLTKLKFLLLD